MRKVLSLLVLTGFFVAAGAAWAAPHTATFAIEKMHCALCPVTVTKAIERVEGVSAVKVDFDRKEAVVTYDDAVTTLDAIMAASTNAGYPAHVKERR